MLEQLLGVANDVGLYAEEVDPASGEQLGNIPQAFTHMAVVTSCSAISAAGVAGPPPDRAVLFVGACLDRRLAMTDAVDP